MDDDGGQLTRLLKILGSNSSFCTQTIFRSGETKGKAQLANVLSCAGVKRMLREWRLLATFLLYAGYTSSCSLVRHSRNPTAVSHNTGYLTLTVLPVLVTYAGSQNGTVSINYVLFMNVRSVAPNMPNCSLATEVLGII